MHIPIVFAFFLFWLLTRIYLPSQVKTQYLQISNIVDASIKHQISDQYCSKKLYVHMFDMVDTAYSYMEEH